MSTATATKRSGSQTLTCLECGYQTAPGPLTGAELWHYVRTGESRFGGCPDHPFRWHSWDDGSKRPQRRYNFTGTRRDGTRP